MLSSSSASLPSLLASLQPVPAGGDRLASARSSPGAPSFADLLSAAPTAEAPAGFDVPDAAALDAGPQAFSPQFGTAGARIAIRQAPSSPPAGEPRVDGLPAQPATAAGKILPVALPVPAEVADTKTATDQVAAIDTAQAELEPGLRAAMNSHPEMALPIVVASPLAVAEAPAERGEASPAGASRAALIQLSVPGQARAASGGEAGSKKRGSENTASDTRSPIAITVRPERAAAELTPERPVAASAELAAPNRAKSFAVAGTAAGEPTPAAPQAPTVVSAAPQLDPSPLGPSTVARGSPDPAPALVEFAAAIEILAAAREAAAPAGTDIAIDHAEFGEVSIRLEQSSAGRLSVELSAADPELQRAVNAAIGTERGGSLTSDGDGGRGASQLGQRSTTAERDASPGSEPQQRNDRDQPHQHAHARPQAGHAQSDTRSGVFA